MDIEESWKRAADLLKHRTTSGSHPSSAEAFPDGLERAASALVATIGVDDVVWVETRSDLDGAEGRGRGVLTTTWSPI